MMCAYCDERTIMFGHQKNLIIEMLDKGKHELMTYIRFDDDGEHYVLTTAMFAGGIVEFSHESQINYCPICGRKLEAEPCADLDDC